MTITASPVPILKDNYAWLLRDSDTGATAIVDPADAQPIIEAVEMAGGRLDLILLTHHHADHIAGVTHNKKPKNGAEEQQKAQENLCSDCPLACKHLGQLLTAELSTGAAPPRQSHPIEIFARAYGMM